MTIGLPKRLARIEGAILVDSRTPIVSRVTLDREGPNLAGPDDRGVVHVNSDEALAELVDRLSSEGEDGRPRLILIRRIVDVGPP
jgi:hypothetical protein